MEESAPLRAADAGSDGLLPPPDLRAKVVGGVGWKIATQIVAQGTRTLVAILLAHLLTPHDYGVAAMALVFAALAPLFTDFSLGSALIQRPFITEADRSTAFWTTAGASLAVTGAAIGCAPLVADFFRTPDVAPLFAVTSISITLSGLSATQFALLNREMAFRSLQIREMTAVVAGAVVAILVALGGGGAWAIVIQFVVTDAVSSVLVWRICAWRPSLIYSRQSLRELGAFGAKTLGSRVLAYLRLNADNLLVGRFLGSGALGIYAVAYNVMFAPVTRITQPVQQVIFPAFARLQNDRERLANAWLRGNRLIAALTAPAFLGMAIVAPDFIPVVLGRRWEDAVPVVQLLSLAGVVLSVEQLNATLLPAIGRPGALLKYMLASTLAVVGGFAIGLEWGVVGVAALYLIASAAFAPVYAFLMVKTLGLPLSRFLGSIAGVAEASAVMAVAVGALRWLMVEMGVAAPARIGVLVAAGLVTYCAYISWRAPYLVTELRALRSPRLADVPGTTAQEQ